MNPFIVRASSADAKASKTRHPLAWSIPIGFSVKVAFGDVPWGGKFGNVRDRYQNDWFILS